MTERSSATANIIAEDSDQSQEVETRLKQRYVISRVETNLERLPIWSPKPKRGTVFTPYKIIELEPEQLPDGQLIQRKVKIVPSALYGYPTTQTQEYWYAFQKLWHDSLTKETGRVEFSRRQVIEDVLGKTYGRDTRKALDLSINQLGSTRFEFDYVFYEKESDTTHRELRKFHLIVDEHLTTRKRGNEIIHEKCFVTLHSLIVSNLRCGYFKPILLSIVSQLKSDVARLLYRKLDSQFSHYTKYEISTERFFRGHALEGGEYRYPSARKRLLEKAIQELVGKPTSSGAVIAGYQIVKTANGKDWKIIVVRSKAKRHSKSVEVEIIEVNTESAAAPTQKNTPEKPVERPELASKSKQVVNHRATPSEPSQGDSEVSQILGYFHEKSGSEIVSNPKIISTVNNLIAKHGVKFVRYMIDYAFVEAKKSGYHPQVFNGIKQYEKGALKSFKEFQRTEGLKKQQEDILRKKRLEDAKIDHERKYTEQYYHYIDELVDSLNQQYPEKFGEFLSWQETILEKEKENANGNTKLENIVTQHFNSQTQIVLRLRRHFEDDPEINIPMYWQWDELHNPHGWGKQKKAANS